MSWDFERVAGPYEFTEGPVWTGESVLFTDIRTDRVLAFDPETQTVTTFRSGTNGGNGLKPGPEGKLYACESDYPRVARYEPDGSTTTVAAEYRGDRLNSPNDLAIDSDGRVWFTDPDYADQPDVELDHRSVYRADPAGDDEWELTRVTTDTTNPNGLLVSPDETRLYVAQTDYRADEDMELRAYPIDDDGSVSEYTVLHNFDPHRGVDGMCLDVDGNIVAAAGWPDSGPGPMVYVFAPNGRVLETHPFPTLRPTNCCFAGPDLQTLYVTAADGCLWRAETDRRGLLGPPANWSG